MRRMHAPGKALAGERARAELGIGQVMMLMTMMVMHGRVAQVTALMTVTAASHHRLRLVVFAVLTCSTWVISAQMIITIFRHQWQQRHVWCGRLMC